jgi:hypothetical protein
MKPELKDGAPAGSIFMFHPSRWLQLESFTTWFEHFISVVKPSKVDPALLILDGHATHVRNLDAIDLATYHTLHRMQPLDVSFMKPLTVYYNCQFKIWLRQNPSRTVAHYQRGRLFGAVYAYSRAASIETAVNGFKKTRMYPVNRYIFVDHEFVAAECLLLVRSSNE